ncbi:hypothetical protein BDY19DRAFT_773129 [Irpex rosettiformis]|uniref:Uncharacterized protein n=1 Tax=Irpex rosettiformis TaxID=378272 RepID=A0ACB8U7U4_9APHY|nr:hypothetical protein BDY19DRAFT_773129 [Irpex rosettiformis]
MADQAELAFVKKYAETIGAQPVNYTDDFQPPLQDYLPRVPTLLIPVPPPPEKKQVEDTALTGAISIIIKSTKPAWTSTLSVDPADTIATVKTSLASLPGAPPADSQRLLLKGKALVDTKLLKEYDVKEGDTVNLMVRAGSLWDPSQLTNPSTTLTASPGESGATTPLITTSAAETEPESITLVPEQTKQTRSGHTRIPSVVLSPSPSLTPIGDEKLIDIPLTLDTSNLASASLPPPPNTPYHTKIAQADFWQRLHAFLSCEFESESDAEHAWEDFFCASKGTLSVSEIAKIRDTVGVLGMAGS